MHGAQRATPRIKLHKPLIKLIKKRTKCVIAQQPSTTNQNATQGIYKGYKVARKVLIGVQY